MDTSTPPMPEQPAPAAAAHPADGFFAAVRRTGITRADDRWVAGVSSGIADRFGIDPLLVRGVFAASLLLGGLGLIAYGIAWALLPERSDGRIHTEEMILGRFDIALLGALAFVLVGFGRGDTWFFFWGPPGWVQGLLWLLFAAGIAAIVLVVVNQNPRPVPQTYGGPQPAAPFAGQGQGHAGPQAATTYAASTATPPASSAPVDAMPPEPVRTYAAPGYTPQAYAAPGYASPTYAPPPAYVPPPPTKPKQVRHQQPPRPPRTRTPGAGAGALGVVVALSLLALATLMVAERSGEFDGPVALTSLGIAIVLAGLGIIVSGLRGRTSGALGALAVLGLLASVPLGVATSASSFWSRDGERQFNAADVAVSSRSDAADGYSMGFGDVTIDLTSVPMTDDTLVVPIALAAGNLTVVVPDGADVDADVNIGAGEITWDVDGDHRSQDGVAIDDGNDFSTGSSDPELELQIRVGAGQVQIIDSRTSDTRPLPPAPAVPAQPGEETP
ncbi:PspC domain-containing protein [Cellulomonas sp. URHE0023]|uniref:PspC domain-containing protein n=1 Tax=Cellulomonas sp. URHE0023 TaxID=1380354 RepID=UPI0004829DFD|nr:PspC domain-containing protein [Cellulomonas sp. URHE0023]